MTSASRLDHFECHYLSYKLVEDQYSKEPGKINEIFIDTTIRDMFHFYDISNKKYKRIIGNQICEYSDGMNLDSIPGVEKYWWFRKIVNLKLEYGIPVSRDDLEKVAAFGDRNVQYELGKRLAETEPDVASGWLMLAADKGHSDAKALLKEVFDNSLATCKKLAESGNASAQFRLAKMYRDGKGVDKDKGEALKWMGVAAEHGHAGAKMNLLDMVEPSLAFQMCREMAESGNKDAQFRLAKMYIEGRGVEKNTGEAYVWITKAIEQGHQKAKEILDSDPNFSNYSVDVLISEGSIDSLTKVLDTATDQGRIAKAQYRLALIYRDAKGVPMDQLEARAWMSKAAKNGHSEAIRCMGKRSLGIDIKRFVDEGLEKRPEEIESECRKLAEQGCPDALGHLGKTYIKNGIGDSSEAVEMIRTAIDGGWDDNSVLKTLWDAELFKDLEAIAGEFSVKGDGIAMGFLGRMCRDGKGVEKDLQAAAEWMREASDNGNTWAYRELLGILWKIGTPESYSEMAAVAPMLAKKGDSRAIAYLGRMYRDGCGVPKSKDAAAFLLGKASKEVKWAERELEKLGVKDYSLQSMWRSGKH